MLNLSKFSIHHFDWAMLTTVVLLIAIGLASIYSVDLSRGNDLTYFKKQVIACLIGLVLLAAASLTQYTSFRYIAKWWYSLALLLLGGVLLFGDVIRGTKGWFVIGDFSFQPVEFAKVGLILMLAYIISRFGRRFERPLFFFGSGAVAVLPIILVLLQPDLGSAVLLGLIWFGLMLLLRSRRLHVMFFLILVVVVGVIGWLFLLEDYQKARFITFINPSRDPLGAGYNITQSVIAVGAGKTLGRGLGFGSQSQLRFLPEAQTDFIFSVVGEELGLAGVIFILVLFGVLFWRLLLLTRRTGDDFAATVVCGIIILFFSQFFINIGADIGLLPITGVTLPFISYGGSSLVINLLLIGMAESVVERRY